MILHFRRHQIVLVVQVVRTVMNVTGGTRSVTYIAVNKTHVINVVEEVDKK